MIFNVSSGGVEDSIICMYERLTVDGRWNIPTSVIVSALRDLLGSSEFCLQNPTEDAIALWNKVRETECLAGILVRMGAEFIFTFSQDEGGWDDLIDRLVYSITHASGPGSFVASEDLTNDVEPDWLVEVLADNSWLVFLLLLDMFGVIPPAE